MLLCTILRAPIADVVIGCPNVIVRIEKYKHSSNYYRNGDSFGMEKCMRTTYLQHHITYICI